MSEPRPGFVRTPTPLAAALIAASVLPLPAQCRDRWRDEYRAELVDLPRSHQIIQAASALAGSFSLRSAVMATGSKNDALAIKPWSCRLRHHRYYTVNQDNEENRKYQHRECIHCGKIKEGDAADFPRPDRPFMGGLIPLG